MFAGDITWNGMKPVTSWQKKNTLIGIYCMYNIISLQNMTLKIPIARKNSILDVGKVSLIQLCFTYTFDKKLQQPTGLGPTQASMINF